MLPLWYNLIMYPFISMLHFSLGFLNTHFSHFHDINFSYDNVRTMKWSCAGHINCLKYDRWTSRVTTLRPCHENSQRQRRPVKRWRDDLDKCWSDTIWQRTAQHSGTSLLRSPTGLGKNDLNSETTSLQGVICTVESNLELSHGDCNWEVFLLVR